MKFPSTTETDKRVCREGVKRGYVKLPGGISLETFGELGCATLRCRLRELRANAHQCARAKFDGKMIASVVKSNSFETNNLSS